MTVKGCFRGNTFKRPACAGPWSLRPVGEADDAPVGAIRQTQRSGPAHPSPMRLAELPQRDYEGP
jgi:hypothetical protein